MRYYEPPARLASAAPYASDAGAGEPPRRSSNVENLSYV